MAWRAPVRPEHERSDRQAVKGLQMSRASAGVERNSQAPTPARIGRRRTEWRIGRRGALIELSFLTGVFYVAGPAPPVLVALHSRRRPEWDLANRMGSAQTEHRTKNLQDELSRARREQWLQECRDTRALTAEAGSDGNGRDAVVGRRLGAGTAAFAGPRVVWPDKDCAAFAAQAEAQATFKRLPWDHHHLDGDDDGVACEALAEAEWRQRLIAAEVKRDQAKQADDQARGAAKVMADGVAAAEGVVDWARPDARTRSERTTRPAPPPGTAGLVGAGHQGHVIDAQAKAIQRSGEAARALEEAQRALEAEQVAGPQVTR